MDFKKLVLLIVVFTGIILPGFTQDKLFPVPEGNSNQLFYLQRTSNTNTIIYELNFKNGIVDPEEPVHVFWIRYQENGQKEDLNFVQKKFAYGLKARKISDNQYELNFVSYKKYKMYLRLGADNKFYVYANINQKPAILTSIFIKINGGAFWSPNIEYVEISGIGADNRSIVKERFKI